MRQWNQKTTTARRVSIFSDDKETFLKNGKHHLPPSSKAAPEPRKKPEQKDARFSRSQRRQRFCKSQYNFNNSICSVHQAVKKYIHSTILLFTHQCIPIVLYNISCRMFLRRGIFLHLEIYTITCLLFLKNGNVPALSSFLLTWKKEKKLLEIPNEGDGIPLGLFSQYPHKSNFSHCSSPSGLLLHYHWYYVLKLKLPRCVTIKHLQLYIK